MKGKKLIKVLLIVIGVIIILLGGLFTIYKCFFDPYRGTVSTTGLSKALSTTITKEEALEDLSFILDRLEERHPACMKGIPIEVLEQYESETNLLKDKLTVLELWQSSARILAKLKDAHTGIRYSGEDQSRLPLTFDMEDGILFCTDQEYLNYSVKSINGIPFAELYQTYLKQFSYELENYASYNFSTKFPLKLFLEFIGVNTSSDITIIFQTPSGEQEYFFTFEIPQEENTSEEAPFVSYDIDKNNRLGILTLLSCNYNDFYKETVKQFFTEVKNNDIRFVAVDLRNNGGGNSMVANEFLRYLNVDEYYVAGGVDVRYGSILFKNKKNVTKNKKNVDLLFSGKVYALTSDRTFSSAKMFANIISDNEIGELIGEIPGNMPASYGDILLFETPNTKLVFTVSFKYFGRIDTAKAALPLLPDYEIKADNAIDKLKEVISMKN